MTEVFLAKGVWASARSPGAWIDLKEIKPPEKPAHIGVEVNETFGRAGLTPTEARELADQLREFADRVERRNT